MSAAWRGEGVTVAGRPFNAKAQRWLNDVLFQRVWDNESALDKALIPHVVAWYQERALDFVDWRPYMEFGRRLREGRWVFCETDYCEKWASALRAANGILAAEKAQALAIADATRFTSLGAWLDAERRGKLEGRGVEGGKPRFSDGQQYALYAAAYKRRACWPRNCRDCGESFRPSKHGAARCAQCLTAFRSERAAKSPKARRPHTPELPAPMVAPAESFEQARLRGRLDVAESAFDRMNEELRLLYELKRQNRGVNDGDAR